MTTPEMDADDYEDVATAAEDEARDCMISILLRTGTAPEAERRDQLVASMSGLTVAWLAMVKHFKPDDMSLETAAIGLAKGLLPLAEARDIVPEDTANG